VFAAGTPSSFISATRAAGIPPRHRRGEDSSQDRRDTDRDLRTGGVPGIGKESSAMSGAGGNPTGSKSRSPIATGTNREHGRFRLQQRAFLVH
jgi:hypothetical protein